MRFLPLGLLVMASFLAAQVALNSPQPATLDHPNQPARSGAVPLSQSKVANVSFTTPVITVHGLCDELPSSAKGERASSKRRTTPKICKTVITRGEFEALANALQPNMDPATKRQLAVDYANLLRLQHQFRSQGLDKDPQVRKALAFAAVRAEAEQMTKRLQEQSAVVTDADVEQYYKSNSFFYDTAELLRINIPKDKRKATADTSAADQEEMRSLAENLRARASEGEDFTKLQNEAYEAAGIAGPRPPVNLGKLTANELPPTQRSAMSLKDGEVSQLIVDPNGFFIFKVLSKDVKPISQVQNQIKPIVSQQKYTKLVQQVEEPTRTELNDDYFPAGGGTNVPSSFGVGGRGFGGFNSRMRSFGNRSGRGARFNLPPLQSSGAAQTGSSSR
ncbi:MAG TPA: peptidyl-prolyl cis-trans isomerase [Terriglobales bacterium]|nr:peptidyl-prolyl cis-trans isomerase [Terriglobales bacterium]